jgi:hypothetical protein
MLEMRWVLKLALAAAVFGMAPQTVPAQGKRSRPADRQRELRPVRQKLAKPFDLDAMI